MNIVSFLKTLASSSIAPPQSVEVDSVVVLTEKNFDEVIQTNLMVLVDFYAPWCGHCKNLEPEYKKAASIIRRSGTPPVLLAKVDATSEKELASRFDIDGYPTLLIFEHSFTPQAYAGPRTAEGIVEYLRSWKAPKPAKASNAISSSPGQLPSGEADAVVVLTESNFDQTIMTNPMVLVEFYAPWCGHCKTLEPEYSKAASMIRKAGNPPVVLAKVDATVEKDLATRFSVKGYPTLKLFERSVANPSPYEGPRDANGIVEHLRRLGGPPSTALSDAGAAEKLRDASPVMLVVALGRELDAQAGGVRPLDRGGGVGRAAGRGGGDGAEEL